LKVLARVVRKFSPKTLHGSGNPKYESIRVKEEQ
jgi:hypothetical protein